MNKIIISKTTKLIALLLFLTNSAVQAMPKVNFIDQSNAANSDIPVTFGQVFAVGAVPAGMSVDIVAGTTSLPTQVDIKATHADGSLRHAVISSILPALNAGQNLAADIIVVNPTATGTAISAADLLATNFDTVVELTLDGVVYTASARDALLADSSKRWLEGTLATEFTLKRSFSTTSGVAHPHLMARFDVRAYQGLESVRVDVVVENNWTYVPSPSNHTYDAYISIGGQQVYSLTQSPFDEGQPFTHYRHTRWHEVFWWGIEPQVYAQHDVSYIQLTKAVPNYDPNVIISESALETQGQVFYTPMSNVELNDYMPAGGADIGIGPLPRWAARYLMSGDIRAYNGVLANGDAGGSYSGHFRDINTDLPVSLDDYPNVNGDSAQFPRDNLMAQCDSNCSVELSRDTAHQPSIAYLPYLITGDYFYLEELLFWANSNLISSSLATRGSIDNVDDNSQGVIRGQQVRGQGWSLRTLAQAAYITPDAHRMKSYFNNKLLNNMDYYLARFPNNPTANNIGALPHRNSLDTAAPWMDDFFTWAVAYTVELGYTEFSPMLEWKAKYPVERMASADGFYCWIFGGVYQLSIGIAGNANDPNNWYQDLGEAYLETF
ncbi:hypothetical protein MNBD_GAMMA01-200, partial [hydrothermal vent metagenome]